MIFSKVRNTQMTQLDAYTNCSFIQLGDNGGLITNFRKCKILTWDGDKYCDVLVYSDWSDSSKGLVTSILSKYLYKTIYPFPVEFFTDDELQTVTKFHKSNDQTNLY